MVQRNPLLRYFLSRKTFAVGKEKLEVVMVARQRSSNDPALWLDPLYQIYRPHTGPAHMPCMAPLALTPGPLRGPNTMAKRLGAIQAAYTEITEALPHAKNSTFVFNSNKGRPRPRPAGCTRPTSR